MSSAVIATHGVMEGGGSYNLHAKIPAGGGGLALPYLEKAAQSCALSPGSNAIIIADYGSSQGKNSLSPMQAAIRCLRMRVGNERSVMVVHVDQHANDFNTLFDVLHRDPERYALDDLTFSRVPLEDRSTRTSFHKDKLISAGALMLPSGSAVFLL